jgi:uncharacterized membrane protein (DUF485 family)
VTVTDDVKPDSDSDLPPTPDHQAYLEISEQQDFVELRRRYQRFAFPATAAFMVWYITYVVANNWARDFMNTPVYGHINVALVFGLLQFVSTFAIAWLYSRHATKALDPLSTRIREEFEEMTGR